MNNMTTENAYAIILHNPKNFNSLPKELKSDKEFIKRCLKVANFTTNLQCISEELKHDKQFVREVVEIKHLALLYMGKEFHSQKEYILLAVEQDPFIFEMLDEEFHVYKNNLDKLRDDVKIEKLKDKLEIRLEPVNRLSKIKKI